MLSSWPGASSAYRLALHAGRNIAGRYGLSFFLSRNQTLQQAIKTLKKKSGSDFYEKRTDFMQDLAWA